MVTAPNVTEIRENVEINNFLQRRRKMCEHLKTSEIIFSRIFQRKISDKTGVGRYGGRAASTIRLKFVF